MARPKAVETTDQLDQQDPVADRQKAKADELHTIILNMIPKMIEGTTMDMNKHQIQASVYSRLEFWANKQMKDPASLFNQAGVESWDHALPRYVSLVSKLSEERHNKNEKIKERAALLKTLSVERQAEVLLGESVIGS
jgi:hypothetical protein